MPIVNDIHSQLNATEVAEIATPRDPDELRATILDAGSRGLPVSIAGGRHAMGGQQFCAGGLLVDTTAMRRTLAFDADRGFLEMEAGAQWPDVIRATHELQEGDPRWGIRQKQTGADSLTLGGSVAANVHGRGLLMGPIVSDIESLTVVTPDGELVRCSREESPELFSLVVGGYGLFGAVATVTLRLGERQKLRRIVNVMDVDEAVPAFYRRVADGCLYGDFQYAIDPSDEDFLRRGVLACYAPAGGEAEVTSEGEYLTSEQWVALLELALTDKRRALQLYSQHYVSTHGNVYWSDTMQLSTYVPAYVEILARAEEGDRPGSPLRGAPEAAPRIAQGESLVIGEMYSPPESVLEFLARSRHVLRETGAEDIYGTIRAIRKDETTFLPWAREDFACVIFNLRTRHSPEGIAHTNDVFRRLCEAALGLGGSFYLTYGRASGRDQVERAYPEFPEFLQKKRQYDPELRFQSEWWRHYDGLFG